MHVVAGVMIDASGRLLLAQRPPGKHLAGLWEFPGGKLEPGEAPVDALARELDEELGVAIDQATPLLRLPWRYGERQLLLDVWRVAGWRGEPRGMEGQALRWAPPRAIDQQIMAPADRMILQALRLPPHYLITPAELGAERLAEVAAWARAALARGERLLQLRLPSWPFETVRALAASLRDELRLADASVLLHGDIEGALALGTGVGVQLSARQLRQSGPRPLPLRQPIGASCHDAEELDLALALGADFATLAPIHQRGSQPGERALDRASVGVRDAEKSDLVLAHGADFTTLAPVHLRGSQLDAVALDWARFGALAEAAALPVYALAGLAPTALASSLAHAGQGVAGVDLHW